MLERVNRVLQKMARSPSLGYFKQRLDDQPVREALLEFSALVEGCLHDPLGLLSTLQFYDYILK